MSDTMGNLKVMVYIADLLSRNGIHISPPAAMGEGLVSL